MSSLPDVRELVSVEPPSLWGLVKAALADQPRVLGLTSRCQSHSPGALAAPAAPAGWPGTYLEPLSLLWRLGPSNTKHMTPTAELQAQFPPPLGFLPSGQLV